MIEYIKLYWLDASADDPCIILYEVHTDNDRLAMRSIDIFADGTSTNIDDLYATAIEITPIPTVEELNRHEWGENFKAELIDKDEFEAIWDKQLPCIYSRKSSTHHIS